MAEDEKTIRSVADEIVRYFEDHPNAADTMEGICQWWLGSEHSIANVQAALDRLVARGIVRCHNVPGKPPIYMLGNPSA